MTVLKGVATVRWEVRRLVGYERKGGPSKYREAILTADVAVSVKRKDIPQRLKERRAKKQLRKEE